MNTIWEVYEYYMPYVEVNTYREGFYARLLGVPLLGGAGSNNNMKKILPVEKMFVTLRSPKMGKLCPVYPSKVRFFRLLDVLRAYPSAPQNRHQSEEILTNKRKNIIVSKIKK